MYVFFLGACNTDVLAQSSCHFVNGGSLSLWRDANRDKGRATLFVGSLSLRRHAKFDIARPALSTLYACRMAPVVARY